ncbi:uncharacterized protein LOC117105384 [Anneissia japonica]|uniref:uncharacterized protein LOC117105384 n=1 Tax=Anneissia japonica TaxID=1529436 RepID=UPI0014258A5E|nr:uncharacterized protein LOC117105384 [Anneissia japonica]
MLYNPDSMINLPATVGISRPAAECSMSSSTSTILLPPTNNVTAAATEESDDQTPTVEEHHQTYNSTYSNYCTLLSQDDVIISSDSELDNDDTINLMTAIENSLQQHVYLWCWT